MKPTLVLFAALALVVATTAALAQRPNYSAGRKMTGEIYRPYTARTYQRHAYDHARVLQYYAQTHEALPQDTAQEHAKAARHNLDLAMKEFAKLAEEAKGDPVASGHLAAIREHQKKAAEACAMLEAECAKHTVQGAAVAPCCITMTKELEAAEAEHARLMKHLGVPLPSKGAAQQGSQPK